MSDFNPRDHLRKLRGKGGDADYLDVKWRIVWLRHEHPEAAIETEKMAGGMESNYAEFRALVSIPGGGSATGYGSESKADFGDFIEKAETKAIGRAIAALGYGTQFVGNELDEGERIVDAPVDRRRPEHGAEDADPRPTNYGVVLYEPANPPARTARTPSPPPIPRPAVVPPEGGGPPPTPLTEAQERVIAEVWEMAEAGDTYNATKALVLTLQTAATDAEWTEIRRRWFKVREQYYPLTIKQAAASAAG